LAGRNIRLPERRVNYPDRDRLAPTQFDAQALRKFTFKVWNDPLKLARPLSVRFRTS
jgi:hypothetical protein